MGYRIGGPHRRLGEGGLVVQGHLPMRYLRLVWIAGLLGFGSLGSWVAYRLHGDAVPTALLGAGFGVAVGAGVVATFVHLLEAPPRGRQVRHLRPS